MSVTKEAIRTHGIRLLNPFRGVMNIIEYQGAEAVTIDGINWDIYVKDISLTADLSNTDNMLISEIRFGHWSEQSGLTRGPIYPSEDFDQMEQQGIRVYEYLMKNYHKVPFSLTDNIELWLLDTDDKPLALLTSAYTDTKLHYDFPLKWTAGNACRQYFKLPDDSATDHHRSNAEQLEAYISELSGNHPRAQWFRRSGQTACGLSGINLDNRLQQRELNNASFPEYFVRDGSDMDDSAIDFPRYLNFLSPFLLTLPALTREQRRHYEKASRAQALCVDRLHRLYPEICELKYINAARVEARLRQTRVDEPEYDTSLSPEYIELGASRTN